MIDQCKTSLLAGSIYSSNHQPADLRLLMDLNYINTIGFNVDEVRAHAISFKFSLLAWQKMREQKDNQNLENILKRARSAAMSLHGHILGAGKVVEQIIQDADAKDWHNNICTGKLKNSRGAAKEFVTITTSVYDQDSSGQASVTEYNYFLPSNLLPDKNSPSSPRNLVFMQSYFRQQVNYLYDCYSAAENILDEVDENDITSQNVDQLLLWAQDIVGHPVPLQTQP